MGLERKSHRKRQGFVIRVQPIAIAAAIFSDFQKIAGRTPCESGDENFRKRCAAIFAGPAGARSSSICEWTVSAHYLSGNVY